MSTHIDWRTEIDSSVEHLPDRPPGVYVAAGRSAVRRRRLVAGVAGLTAVVMVGGIGWALTRADAPVASDPAAPSSSKDPDAKETQRDALDAPWAAGEPPARVSPGTGLQIRDGAVVHERRDNLYPGKDTESVALDLTFEDKRWWVLLEWRENGSSSMHSSPAGEMADSFEDFISESTAGGGLLSAPEGEFDEEFPYAGLVNYSTDGLLVREGVEMVRRVDNPMSLKAPKSSIGLVVEHAGSTTWMLLTASPSGSSGTSENAAESGWPTFDLWLAENVALQTHQPRLTLATLAQDGSLRPGEDGVQILDQQTNPVIPGYVDDSATASGVAMLLWQGETWFILAARYDRENAISTFAASKAGGADDIDSFLDFARDRFEEGGRR